MSKTLFMIPQLLTCFLLISTVIYGQEDTKTVTYGNQTKAQFENKHSYERHSVNGKENYGNPDKFKYNVNVEDLRNKTKMYPDNTLARTDNNGKVTQYARQKTFNDYVDNRNTTKMHVHIENYTDRAKTTQFPAGSRWKPGETGMKPIPNSIGDFNMRARRF